MNVSLVMFKSDGSRRDFPITKEKVVVGRKPDCDLRIPLSSVSRQHCEIHVTEAKVSVRDLGSSNGTFHNNVRVQEAVLDAGDEIVIGPVVFTVVIDGEPGTITPVRSDVAGNASDSGATVSRDDAPRELPDASDDLPQEVEEEHHSPTVDLDDPIAALERLAQAEEEPGSADDDNELHFLIDDDEDNRNA